MFSTYELKVSEPTEVVPSRGTDKGGGGEITLAPSAPRRKKEAPQAASLFGARCASRRRLVEPIEIDNARVHY
jgi:hypothetical protein